MTVTNNQLREALRLMGIAKEAKAECAVIERAARDAWEESRQASLNAEANYRSARKALLELMGIDQPEPREDSP